MLTHFSSSQLCMFLRCGEQYKLRYLEGIIVPPGLPAKIGSGVHKGVEVNLRAKIETGEDMPLDVVQDASAEAYDKALRNGVFFAHEELPSARKQMAEGKDSVVSLITLHHKAIAPTLRPLLVEHRTTIELPGIPLPIVTILDCYTADKALRDTKTSSKAWNKDKADSSPQPTLYREAVKQETGAYPEKIIFDVLVKSKEPKTQYIETQRNTEDLLIVTDQFALMSQSIETGIFIPATPDHWCCSPKWCGYFYQCKYIPAHRKILPKRSA